MSYAGKIDINGTEHLVGSTLYGTCTTAASTAAKVVTLADYDELMEGTMVQVKFTNSNTAANPTLNVNGTGAKPIYRYGTITPGNTQAASWMPNAIMSFVYDGTAWMMMDVNPVISEILKTVYPVGSIYMSVNSTDPGTLFGGTWARIQDTFLLAAGTTYAAASTGGAATRSLTTANLPAHTHGEKSMTGNIRLKGINGGYAIGDANNAQEGLVTFTRDGGAELPHIVADGGSNLASDLITINATHEHESVGSGTAFGILPPYLAVYVWKRTA